MTGEEGGVGWFPDNMRGIFQNRGFGSNGSSICWKKILWEFLSTLDREPRTHARVIVYHFCIIADAFGAKIFEFI